MNRRKAKSLTLKVWRYLAGHPEIKTKYALPKHISDELHKCASACPLCVYFNRTKHRGCSKKGKEHCPLAHCMRSDYRGNYDKWLLADTNEERKAAAEKIVQLVEAWEVK